jgi:ADP-heptose:LPS heptosyltransferase
MEKLSNLANLVGLSCALIAGAQLTIFTRCRSSNVQNERRIMVGADSQNVLLRAATTEWPRKSTSGKPTTRRPSRNTIVIHVHASGYAPERRVPLEVLRPLIAALWTMYPDTAFVFGGSEHEWPYTEYVVRSVDRGDGRIINCAGKWSLERFVREVRECRVFVTGDSGPLHLARYFEVPTVAVWGPTQPEQFEYSDTPTFVNVTLKTECSPCLIHPLSSVGRECRGSIPCLHRLHIDAIVQALRKVISPLAANEKRVRMNARVAEC